MQPTQGQGYWNPDGESPEGQGDGDTPTQDASTPPSAYNGYELTEQQYEAEQADISQEIQWEASEYVHHEKDTLWFTIVLMVSALFIVLSIVFRQWTFTALIIAMLVALIIYARRPPRTLRYHLSHKGVIIEDKFYPLHEFRAFGILQDGPLFMVNLLPRKRFMPAIAMYFEQRDGERIVDILAANLPHQQIKQDFVDTITRKLRF